MKDLEKILTAGCEIFDSLEGLTTDDTITVLAGVVATLAAEYGVSYSQLTSLVLTRIYEMES